MSDLKQIDTMEALRYREAGKGKSKILWIPRNQPRNILPDMKISALYPDSTVLLAWIFLKERISPVQGVGIALAFIAIVLFTL